MSLGDMIAEKRTDNKLSQKELGELLRLSRSSISNYEKDVHAPDIDTLRRMADVFHTATDYLLERIEIDVDLRELSKTFIKTEKIHLTAGDVLKDILSLNTLSRKFLVEYINLLKLKEKYKKIKMYDY